MLADENKKKIYDSYGFMGLKLAEQVGEEVSSALLAEAPVSLFVGCPRETSDKERKGHLSKESSNMLNNPAC